MLTVRQTAERLAVSQTSVYALVRSGELPSFRIGGAIRISEVDVETFLSGCRQARTPPPPVRKERPRLKHIRLSSTPSSSATTDAPGCAKGAGRRGRACSDRNVP